MHGMVIDVNGRPDGRGLARIWPLLVARGGLLAVLGVFLLAWPQLSAVLLVSIFGVYAIVDGLGTAIYGASRRRRTGRGGGWSLQGIFMVGIGVVALIWPATFASFLLALLGFVLLMVGMTMLSIGFGLRRATRGWVWPAGLGAAAIVGGIILFAKPAASLAAVAGLIGVILLLVGLGLVAGGLRLRRAIRTGH
jgi:uncharacterized membrane protein HdeD (DUF308 family)